MFKRRSGQFDSQAITKALFSQPHSNCLLSFSQQQFATLIRNLHSVTQPGGLSLQHVSLITSLSLQLSLHQLSCLYFETQPPHKFHIFYRHLQCKCYRSIVFPPIVKMYCTRLTFHSCYPMSITQLLLCTDLPLCVRRSLVRPLLPIHCPRFVVWSHWFHRSVASIDEMTQHCVTGTQNSFLSHHITSHDTTSHITSLPTTSHHFTHNFTHHHFTSQHFVSFVAKCVHRVTKLHFVVTLESKRNIF